MTKIGGSSRDRRKPRLRDGHVSALLASTAMSGAEDVTMSSSTWPRERLTGETGHWTLRCDLGPGVEAGLRGRVVTDVTGALVAAPDGGTPRPPAARVRQVHGCTTLRVAAPGDAGEADALFTTEPDLALEIRVADCVPLLLSAPGGIAAVHAGWRGAAGGIAERALGALCAATGSRLADIHAWIGPGIATCCFEVGPEVAEAFPPHRRRDGRERPHVDLAGSVVDRLIAAGVPPRSIVTSPYCTRCHQHLWHSHRGSAGGAGRLVAWIARRAQARSSVAR